MYRKVTGLGKVTFDILLHTIRIIYFDQPRQPVARDVPLESLKYLYRTLQEMVTPATEVAARSFVVMMWHEPTRLDVARKLQSEPLSLVSCPADLLSIFELD